MLAKTARTRSFKGKGAQDKDNMGVSLVRRHSFDQFVLRQAPSSKRRVSEMRGKWASTSQLRSSSDLRDVEIQVDGVANSNGSRRTSQLSADDAKAADEERQRADEASSNRNPDDEEERSLSRVSSSGFIAMCNSQRLDVRGRFEGWELKRSEIQLKQKLGQGDGGVIHFAKWRGLKCVAKMLRTESENGERPRISPAVARQDLVNEITVLSHLRHPNLVLFLGACSKGEPLVILNEFLPGGNLEEFIHRTWISKAQWRPSPFQVLQWGIELARALSFLHNCTTPIVHRDLKPANLLLDGDLHLKVCDFGLSKLRELQCVSGSYKMTGQTGSLRYMAPEVFQYDPSYDERVDLYSAGMILWFIATGVRPFDRVSASSVARKAARDGLRPDLQPVKDKHSLALAAVISRCWAHMPEGRPSAMQLVRDLELQHSYMEVMKETGARLPVALRLEAHALFQQALVGPCDLPQPAIWHVGRFGERAKWRAWHSLGDMRRGVALDQLNLLLDDCCPTWRTKSHRTITTGPDGDRHADPSSASRLSFASEVSGRLGLLDGQPAPQRKGEGSSSVQSHQTTASAKSPRQQPPTSTCSREDSSGPATSLSSAEDASERSGARIGEAAPTCSSGHTRSTRSSSKTGSSKGQEEVHEGDLAKITAMLAAVEKGPLPTPPVSGSEAEGGDEAVLQGDAESAGEEQGAERGPERSSSRSLPAVPQTAGKAREPLRRPSTAVARSPATAKGVSRGRVLGGGWGAMGR